MRVDSALRRQTSRFGWNFGGGPMSTSYDNVPEPGITFLPQRNGAIDATAWLGIYPGDMEVWIHELWGADNYTVTLRRPGLEVSFAVSFFHLRNLEQTLEA